MGIDEIRALMVTRGKNHQLPIWQISLSWTCEPCTFQINQRIIEGFILTDEHSEGNYQT